MFKRVKTIILLLGVLYINITSGQYGFDLNFYRAPDYEITGPAVAQLLIVRIKHEITQDSHLGDEGRQMPTKVRKVRSAVITSTSRWPNGVVPYEIDNRFSSAELEVLHNAFRELNETSCVTFRPRDNDKHYVHIKKGYPSQCEAYVGRQGGKQDLVLGENCLHQVGIPIHELMHALGFYHEQSRPDRDYYVYILNHRITEGGHINFKKEEDTYTFGLPYDPESVMHYHSTAFSKDGYPTIVAKEKYEHFNRIIGQRRGLSDIDILKLRHMYCGFWNPSEVLHLEQLIAHRTRLSSKGRKCIKQEFKLLYKEIERCSIAYTKHDF